MKPTQRMLDEILGSVRPQLGQGKVADYIPALAKIPGNKLGMAVCYNTGEVLQAGDAEEPFSIQSISKLFSLALGMRTSRDKTHWHRVGKEPSGLAFNSMVQLEMERGIPRNPFINAGAIVVCDILASLLPDPRRAMLSFVRYLSGNPSIRYDEVVAKSEMEHSDRNFAIAYLMRSFGNFANEVQPVLEHYFYNCALSMSCVDLARAFNFLANRGRHLVSDDPVVSWRQAKRLNALLITCGLYDRAGEFAFRVGMPAKSGVGGGIVAVVPGALTVAVWSPELDPSGNSLVGTSALEELSNRMGISMF